MLSPFYRGLFPGTALEKTAVNYIRTTKGGFRYSTFIGSVVTGFGGDEVIIDDPMMASDATSQSAKSRVRDWVASSVMTRFDQAKNGVLILVMHRLAPDDLSATLSPGADYIFKLPLVAEADEAPFEINGKVILQRVKGQILNPYRMSAQDAEQLKRELPAHVWNGQYQQTPTIGGSGMLSIDKFRRYDPGDILKPELVIHSWDIGATTNGNASVCTVWGLGRIDEYLEALFLLDLIKFRLELPEVRSSIRSMDKRDRPSLILLDERGVGLGVQQELEREGYHHIAGSMATRDTLERDELPTHRPSESKIGRFGRAALLISDGKVLLPKEAPWLEGFLTEVAGFPDIADKDQVDSMTQLVANFDNAIRRARTNVVRGYGCPNRRWKF